ncbi:gamma-glutamyltransferase [Fodinicola acaciae]|uniref:gamma-glutamyltransferase n=1 Tax=Fodinicola acaciae TaxID=2681555 RepID=UPI0013D0F1B6|nr:gamma-glutamyltransferase [Fodinicola acaciae]
MWPEADGYLHRGNGKRTLEAATGSGTRAIVVGSTGPYAQLAGRKVLETGGSAVDAVIATSLAQIALAAGSWVSYAGIFSLVHFASSTGKVDSLSAGFRTFEGETEPATIPGRPEPSGRTALVPGFMAGIAAAHEKFGKLPWADLFQPTLYVAERGFPVGSDRQRQFDLRADVLARTPEARAIFPKLPRDGEVFRQPALARTLTSIAAEGVGWMYDGPWARDFVRIVNREGGRASLEDLRAYAPIWAEPVRASVYGHQIHAAGRPDRGGFQLLEALQLAEDVGDPTTDPEALHRLIQITRHTGRPGSHSDFVLAVDQAGNVAAACHSINTGLWGSTGIFVGGVSIPDAACFQQRTLAAIPPGGHLPFPANPAIAMKAGRPVLASSSIGAGLHVTTLQCVHAVLALGKTVGEAARRPLFHGPDFLAGDSVSGPVTDRLNGPGVGPRWTEAVRKARDAGVPPERMWDTVMAGIPQVIEDRFDPDVLAAVEKRGLQLSVRPLDDATIPRGYWGGIGIADGLLTGARTPFVHGEVEGL